MLTLILCLVVGVVALIVLWTSVKSNSIALAGVISLIFVSFGIIFPVNHGTNLAHQQESFIQTLPVTQIEGKFYYEDDGEWKDVLTIKTIEQADTLTVGIKKAPKSLWYWPMEVKVLYLPLGVN